MTFVRIVAAGLTYIPLFIVVDGYKGNTHILDSSCFNSYGCTKGSYDCGVRNRVTVKVEIEFEDVL